MPRSVTAAATPSSSSSPSGPGAPAPGPDPSLDTRETSHRPYLPSQYRTFLTPFHEQELAATLQTFEEASSLLGPHRLERLRSCRTWAWFARNTTTGEVRVASNACHQRWCPLCASSKAFRIAQGLTGYLRENDNARLITLTLRHTNSPLEGQIDALHAAFRRLRRGRRFRYLVDGGAWFLQVTYNTETSQWNPHLHLLVTGRYYQQHLLSTDWLAASRTSKVCDIRSVRSVDGAARYVARYVARPGSLADLPSQQRIDMVLTLLSRNLYGTWGHLRKANPFAKPPFDKAEWQHIGSWESVAMASSHDEAASAILHAWFTHTPLEPGITTHHIDRQLDDLPMETDPDPPPQQQQFWR